MARGKPIQGAPELADTRGKPLQACNHAHRVGGRPGREPEPTHTSRVRFSELSEKRCDPLLDVDVSQHRQCAAGDAYLIELSRYIHLNPVRAGIVVRADAYPWSSAQDFVGKRSPAPFLTRAAVLGHFGHGGSGGNKS